jgi:putative Ca2+/H+ antiporter (TMEM165/GDT1 family)
MLTAALTTFVVVFLAELPDKSMIATIVLATRFRPLPVWAGVASAFAVHVVIAVAAGHLLGLLPHRVVAISVAILFALGSYLVARGGDPNDEAERVASARRAYASAFGLVFLGEWGDVTQLATANLSARYDAPLAVGAGALLALVAVAGIAVVAGRGLLRTVPLRAVRLVAASVLAVLAILALVDAIRG